MKQRSVASQRWSRRRFLATSTVAAGAVAAGLGSCSTTPADSGKPAPQLAALFSPARILAAGIEQRIPFGLIDQGEPPPTENGQYPVTITKDDKVYLREEVVGRIVTHDHPAGNADEAHQHANLLRYFAVRATLPEPGIYDLTLTVDGTDATMAFQMFDPAEVVIPLPGQRFPDVRFPTLSQPLGMNPICTRLAGICPLHDVTIEEALETGSPVALLVATPALCQTAYCGPVLEVLLGLAPDFPSIKFLHAEVYSNADVVENNYLDDRILPSPTVSDLALTFEPSLFLLQSDRTIVDRIDNVYDNTELRGVLQALEG
ncbi:MAG: twin-arginine translocation signal domain-containing protein [Acidimicrobiales bacterium]|nr:twin-arginine translocation signal domain-containing protein [Acidimicrobiales bacterium]